MDRSTRKSLINIAEEHRLKAIIATPQIEVLDLHVTARDIPLTKNFTGISRTIWQLTFAGATVDFQKFGQDAALANGIQITYNDRPLLPEAIKANADFGKYCFDTRTDPIGASAASVNRILSSRFSFWKFMPRELLGLSMDRNDTFEVNIQDDMSVLGTDPITLTIEGWL
jgi:hypothetical protein